MSFETENITNEEVVSPQGTENINEEVVPPQEQNPYDMTEEEFSEYIENVKNGTVGKEEAPKNESSAPKEEQKKEAFRSFETEEEFQQFMNKTIGDRLKGAKDAQEKYQKIANSLQRLYPDQTPDDAIQKIVADAERQAAEESGKSVEEIRAENELRADAEAYREIKKQEEERQQRMKNIQTSWEQEETQMRSIIPDFDFEKAMENDIFKDAVLKEGLSMSAAYIKALNGTPVAKKKERVFEIATGDGRGAETGKADPMHMSKKDFDEYIRKLKER